MFNLLFHLKMIFFLLKDIIFFMILMYDIYLRMCGQYIKLLE